MFRLFRSMIVAAVVLTALAANAFGQFQPQNNLPQPTEATLIGLESEPKPEPEATLFQLEAPKPAPEATLVPLEDNPEADKPMLIQNRTENKSHEETAR